MQPFGFIESEERKKENPLAIRSGLCESTWSGLIDECLGVTDSKCLDADWKLRSIKKKPEHEVRL